MPETVAEEVRRIISEHRPCVTAKNGTGSRCTCDYDCANYWLRAAGYKAEEMRGA